MENLILAIDTSADDTSAAVTCGRQVLAKSSNSQIAEHAAWGGIVPSIAKRAHQDWIDPVIGDCLKKARIVDPGKQIDFLAVTQGPGLAVALEVGIAKAKELARRWKKPLIAVNHLEGHLYSSYVQNKAGNPKHEIKFPILGMVISGGHTEFVLWKGHLQYELIGQTIDDAAGEALDKAAKMLGLGYPGGPVVERLAAEYGNKDEFHFPRPMMKADNLDFSFSGLKTAFYYFIKDMPESEKNAKLRSLLSGYQEAVFDSIMKKTERAIKRTGANRLAIGGGVTANKYLRLLFRRLVKKYGGQVNFPPYRYLTGDNAAMIGVTAHYYALQNKFASPNDLDRLPRMQL